MWEDLGEQSDLKKIGMYGNWMEHETCQGKKGFDFNSVMNSRDSGRELLWISKT